jgi:cytochrome P450 family 4
VWNELNQVFGDSDRPCTLEDTSKLKYLEACIKEGLRLYPSVPLIERTISENVELDGYHIPAGTSLTLQFYALHRSEDLYPDALKFKPERFIQQHEDGGSVQKHPYAFVPFSAGPRNCIGIYITNENKKKTPLLL